MHVARILQIVVRLCGFFVVCSGEIYVLCNMQRVHGDGENFNLLNAYAKI